MHLHVVMAFALLIWWPRERPVEPIVTTPWAVWTIVLGQVFAVWYAARIAAIADLRTLRTAPDGPHRAQHAHHRKTVLLRGCVLLTFAIDLTVTAWPDMVAGFSPLQPVPALIEIIIILPFLVASVLLLVATYRIDLAIRRSAGDAAAWVTPHEQHHGGLRAYLSFHVRHQLLAVVVPMTIILAAYDLTRDHEAQLAAVLPVPFLPDIALGTSAAGVFVIAPWLLKRIWTTRPLPDGALRRELETTCRRIGLQCRDILVWQSGSMLVNAAVMGLLARVRYVMLSDGLLDAMDRRQIEAVFGHEAGHIRHKHIQFFLLFALASMLISAGVMELLYQWSVKTADSLFLNTAVIQAVGFVTVLLLWGAGFGFISRHFERQADLFGARCVTPPDPRDCLLPCVVHDAAATNPGDRHALCATGAGIFASALDRVALLNGIPHDEPSWRHSSIASRIAFLHALSADPDRVRRFERRIRTIKHLLLVTCVVGLFVSAYYVWPYVGSG